jgi:multidrug transporter EmrE-like cation transporter
MIVLLGVLLIVLLENVSMICLKKYGNNNESIYLTIGIVGYIIISLILMKIITHDKLADISILWSAISILSAIIAGRVFFDEKLDYQDIAIATVIIISITALHHNRKNY